MACFGMQAFGFIHFLMQIENIIVEWKMSVMHSLM